MSWPLHSEDDAAPPAFWSDTSALDEGDGEEGLRALRQQLRAVQRIRLEHERKDALIASLRRQVTDLTGAKEEAAKLKLEQEDARVCVHDLQLRCERLEAAAEAAARRRDETVSEWSQAVQDLERRLAGAEALVAEERQRARLLDKTCQSLRSTNAALRAEVESGKEAISSAVTAQEKAQAAEAASAAEFACLSTTLAAREKEVAELLPKARELEESKAALAEATAAASERRDAADVVLAQAVVCQPMWERAAATEEQLAACRRQVGDLEAELARQKAETAAAMQRATSASAEAERRLAWAQKAQEAAEAVSTETRGALRRHREESRVAAAALRRAADAVAEGDLQALGAIRDDAERPRLTFQPSSSPQPPQRRALSGGSGGGLTASDTAARQHHTTAALGAGADEAVSSDGVWLGVQALVREARAATAALATARSAEIAARQKALDAETRASAVCRENEQLSGALEASAAAVRAEQAGLAAAHGALAQETEGKNAAAAALRRCVRFLAALQRAVAPADRHETSIATALPPHMRQEQQQQDQQQQRQQQQHQQMELREPAKGRLPLSPLVFAGKPHVAPASSTVASPTSAHVRPSEKSPVGSNSGERPSCWEEVAAAVSAGVTRLLTERATLAAAAGRADEAANRLAQSAESHRVEVATLTQTFNAEVAALRRKSDEADSTARRFSDSLAAALEARARSEKALHEAMMRLEASERRVKELEPAAAAASAGIAALARTAAPLAAAQRRLLLLKSVVAAGGGIRGASSDDEQHLSNGVLSQLQSLLRAVALALPAESGDEGDWCSSEGPAVPPLGALLRMPLFNNGLSRPPVALRAAVIAVLAARRFARLGALAREAAEADLPASFAVAAADRAAVAPPLVSGVPTLQRSLLLLLARGRELHHDCLAARGFTVDGGRKAAATANRAAAARAVRLGKGTAADFMSSVAAVLPQLQAAVASLSCQAKEAEARAREMEQECEDARRRADEQGGLLTVLSREAEASAATVEHLRQALQEARQQAAGTVPASALHEAQAQLDAARSAAIAAAADLERERRNRELGAATAAAERRARAALREELLRLRAHVSRSECHREELQEQAGRQARELLLYAAAATPGSR